MGYLSIGNIKLHYLAGPGGLVSSRRSIVFVHGAGGHGGFWDPLRRSLDRGVNTIALDLPGHGFSGDMQPGPADLTRYSTILAQAISALRLDNYVVAGHSMGAAVAMSAALRPDLRPQGLILIGAAASFQVHPRLLAELEEDPQAAASRIVRWSFGPGTSKELLAWARHQFHAADPAILQFDFQACANFDLRQSLAALTIPSLVLGGTDDLMTPAAAVADLGRRLPRATVKLMPGAGHMLMVERPAAVVNAIIAFLASL